MQTNCPRHLEPTGPKRLAGAVQLPIVTALVMIYENLTI
jgi:hypothetical protein